MLSRVTIAVAGALIGMSSVANAASDSFASRTDLGTVAFVSTSGSNVGFTGELGEPMQSGLINSAWWQWTAPGNRIVTIDTFGSNFDTFLTLAQGIAVNALTVLAQNDDAGGTLQSRITFDAFAGNSYQIAVDGFQDSTGDIQLQLNAVPEPSTLLLFASGLAGLAAWRRQRRK